MPANMTKLAVRVASARCMVEVLLVSTSWALAIIATSWDSVVVPIRSMARLGYQAGEGDG